MADTNVPGVATAPSFPNWEDGCGETGWRAIFEQAPVAILVADDAQRFVEVNKAGCALLGAPAEQIIGAPIRQFMRAPTGGAVAGTGLSAADFFLGTGPEGTECVVLRPDGTKRYADCHTRADFRPGWHLCVAHDGTDRKLTDEVVRRAEDTYRSLVETTNTGYLVADHEGRVIDANAEYVRLTGHADLDAIRWRKVREWILPADRDRHATALAACLRDGAVRDLVINFASPAGQVIAVEINATAVQCDEGVRLLSLCRDITSREAARQEVETAWHELEDRVQQRTAQLAQANDQIRVRARQQEAVAEFGRRALASGDLKPLLHESGEMVARLLEVEFATVLEHADPQSDQLLLCACHGWPGRLGELIATTDPAAMDGYVLRTGESVVSDNLRNESRFQVSSKMLESGIVSGITVLIPGEERPFGVIGAHTIHARVFTQDDLAFVRSVAHVLAAAVDRSRSEAIVRAAREAAVKANDAKLDFLSRMSHELRTPLNAILGFGQLLEIENLGAREQESVDQIISAGRHLLHLVNEVLDISRIESGHLTLACEPLSVAELLAEAIDLMRPLAGAENLCVTISPDAETQALYVLADHQRVHQVLLNLLSNAVKYNRSGGRIDVSAAPSPDGRSVRVAVADTGLGIPADMLPRLFTPFDRLGAESTDVEGSGIGLALAQRLMEAHGGQLGVQSTLGEGSTFWLDLPVAAAPTESARVPMEARAGSTPPVPARARDGNGEAAAGGVAQRTVLHIEDNEQNQRLMDLLLALRPNLSLVTAGRGQEGLELARTRHPDLILLDMHLPDTPGEEVLRALRAQDSTRETPVVVVSADATADRQERLRALGANDYLTKPFNVRQFLGIIDGYLQPEKPAAANVA
jgi:PAS domain S-box-containing protein